jgi:phage replication-related protein YjqB (UPF0714/DUF867 family)
VAPHGGAIEPGTSEVAKQVADNDLSLFIFEGIKPKGNKRLHILQAQILINPVVLSLCRRPIPWLLSMAKEVTNCLYS